MLVNDRIILKIIFHISFDNKFLKNISFIILKVIMKYNWLYIFILLEKKKKIL